MSEQSLKVNMRMDKASQLVVVWKLQCIGQKNSGGRSPSTLDDVRVKEPHEKGREHKVFLCFI